MQCPNCGRHYDTGNACPHCHVPARTDNPGNGQRQRVVEAEIIHEHEENSQYEAFRDARGGRHFIWSAQSFGQRSPGLPFLITFILMVVCGVRFGVLASIGFLFFYGIASLLGAMFTMGKLLNGMLINPWIVRCCVWAVSFMITVWLAE